MLGRGRHVCGQAQADRLAHVEALQADDLLGAGADQAGGLVQNPGALAAAHLRPRSLVERGAGSGDGHVGAGGVRVGRGPGDGPGGWVRPRNAGRRMPG